MIMQTIFLTAFLPDDDWQEEHKRLAELDEQELGPGLGGGCVGGESNVRRPEDSSSTHLLSSGAYLPLPSSLSSLSFPPSSSGVRTSGQ